MRTITRIGVLIGTAVGVVLLPVSAASAQDDDVIGQVDIAFDVGDIDPAVGDWTVDAVEVTGDLEDGGDVTVELRGDGDRLLWSGTAPYTGPGTRIEVEGVTVGEVVRAEVAQGITVVAGVQIEAPAVDWSAAGGGGGGQLALSMVMAVLLVAIVFRTPLPSATTQRWTK